ncbi:MAG: LysR family transcriptional regulator [Bacteroidales bacterium]|nr:LysR family transcriptional regulator [Bacteroidales bacterium]
MLDNYRLKVFSVVTREGSFTGAAKELGISQPAVSQHIAELEKSLGCTLLTRARGKVSLNAHGRELREYAERILYWVEKAEQHFLSPDSISSYETAVLPIDADSAAEIHVEDGSLRIRIVKSPER